MVTEKIAPTKNLNCKIDSLLIDLKDNLFRSHMLAVGQEKRKFEEYKRRMETAEPSKSEAVEGETENKKLIV